MFGFIIKAQVRGITKPPIWREVLVSSGTTFYELHLVLQEAFGLDDSHLFEFETKNVCVTIPQADALHDPIEFTHGAALAGLFISAIENQDVVTTIIDVLVQNEKKIVYRYDFGDHWQIDLTLKRCVEDTDHIPQVIAYKGEDLLEDIGGPSALKDMRAILSGEDEVAIARLRKKHLYFDEPLDLNQVNQRLRFLFAAGRKLLPEEGRYDF